MRIEIVATGSDVELSDFQEKLREGCISAFLTDRGTVGIDFGRDMSGQRFRSRVPDVKVGLVLNRSAQKVRR